MPGRPHAGARLCSHTAARRRSGSRRCGSNLQGSSQEALALFGGGQCVERLIGVIKRVVGVELGVAEGARADDQREQLHGGLAVVSTYFKLAMNSFEALIADREVYFSGLAESPGERNMGYLICAAALRLSGLKWEFGGERLRVFI